jgi:hypothetical protein
MSIPVLNFFWLTEPQDLQSIPSRLLSSLGILRRRSGDFVWCRRDDGGVLEWRVGMGLWLGRQQQHYQQQQQQFQQELEHRGESPVATAEWRGKS